MGMFRAGPERAISDAREAGAQTTVARQWLLTGGLPVVSVLPAEEQRAKEILAFRCSA